MKSIIVAMDKNNAIGFENDLPWGRGLKDDMAHFAKTTRGKTVIMGRKTFESMGSKPLPDRQNIVVSSQPTGVKGVMTAASLGAAYALAQYDIYVIGGGQIYAVAMDDMDQLIVTYVDAEFLEATVFFPEIDRVKWHEVSGKNYDADDRNQYRFKIVNYQKIHDLKKQTD
jgi:dihydrofolate reductase